MLKDYESTERGVKIPSPNMTRQIKHHGVMFVDDRKVHIGEEESNEDFEGDFAK